MGRMSSEIQSIRQLTVALRDARVMQKLTQEELAQRTGLTRPWISQFEQGKIMNASISRILLLCRELGVTFTVSYNVPEQQAGIQQPSSHRKDLADAAKPAHHNTRPPTSDEISKMAEQLQPLAGFSLEPYLTALQRLTSNHSPNGPTDDDITPRTTTRNEDDDEDQSA